MFLEKLKRFFNFGFDNKKAGLVSTAKLAGLLLLGLILLAAIFTPTATKETASDRGREVAIAGESSAFEQTADQPQGNETNPSPATARTEITQSTEPNPGPATGDDPNSDEGQQSPDAGALSTNPLYEVNRVIDGDTIEVIIDGQTENLRLIGLDTPETVDPRQSVECFGLEAKNRAQEILGGQAVYLEVDPTQNNRDRYGRLLRHIILADGRNYGLEMIKGGYGHEYTYERPHIYQEEFRRAEAEAREAGRGLWAEGVCVDESQDPNGQTADSDSVTNSGVSAPEANDIVATTTACHPAYNPCLEVVSDLNCKDIGEVVTVKKAGVDPYGLDRDNDGIGCESYS